MKQRRTLARELLNIIIRISLFHEHRNGRNSSGTQLSNYSFTEEITARIRFVQRHVPRQTESHSSGRISRRTVTNKAFIARKTGNNRVYWPARTSNQPVTSIDPGGWRKTMVAPPTTTSNKPRLIVIRLISDAGDVTKEQNDTFLCEIWFLGIFFLFMKNCEKKLVYINSRVCILECI